MVVGGVAPVEPYRVYLVGPNGRFYRVEFVTADNDEAALAKVSAMRLSHTAEVWLLARQVGTVPTVQGTAKLDEHRT